MFELDCQRLSSLVEIGQQVQKCCDVRFCLGTLPDNFDSAFHIGTNAYVSKILKSKALIGVYEPGMDVNGKRVLTGEVWEDYFPRLISDDEWYQLRAARRSRTNQRGPAGNEVANLFTGILFNASDGKPFQRIVKNHPRLISAAYRNGLSDGDTQSFPYAPLENGFLYALAHELKLSDLFGDGQQDGSEDLMPKLIARSFWRCFERSAGMTVPPRHFVATGIG